MSYYLIPYRKIKIRSDKELQKGNINVVLNVELAPEDAFGENCSKRGTFPIDEKVASIFNAFTGEVNHQGKLIPKINTSLFIDDFHVSLNGNKLELQFSNQELRNIEGIIQHVVMLLPSIFTLYFNNYFEMKKIYGTMNNMPFTIELSAASAGITATTQSEQIKKCNDALNALFSSSMQDITLANAIFYFNQACRFYYDIDGTMGLFSEIILNLSKSIEGLFGNHRDRMRDECKKIGLSNLQIEERIIPIIIARNELDVGHVRIRQISENEVEILREFLHCTIKDVHDLLLKVIYEINNKKYFLPSRSGKDSRGDLIKNIENYLKKRNKKTNISNF